jgi:hypothetical protein
LTRLRIAPRSESPRAAAVLQLEDRAADGLDGVVELGHRLVQALGHCAVAGHRGDALELQAGGEEALDDDVVEVARDPLAVGQQGHLLAVRQRLRAVQREPDLVAEADEEVALLHVEQGRAGTGDRDQGRDRGEVRAQRHHDEGHAVDTGRGDRAARADIRGLAGRGEDAFDLGDVDVGCDAEGVVLRSERGPQRHCARAGDLPGGGDDLVERGRQVHRRLQQLREVGRGLEPLPPALAQRERPSVADDVARGPGELLDETLVLVGEGAPAGLLGQVEVAEHRAPDPDRHAEERPHRRVVGREADRRRVGGEVSQA